MHDGHYLQMENAKRLAGEGGISIVGILTDVAIMEKKARPVKSFDERMRDVLKLRCCDLVLPQDTYSPHQNVLNMALGSLKVDILMESASHSADLIKESVRVMQSIGGKVIVTPYYPTQSSTQIKEKIRNAKTNTDKSITH